MNRNIKKSVSAPIGGKDNGLGGSWSPGLSRQETVGLGWIIFSGDNNPLVR